MANICPKASNLALKHYTPLFGHRIAMFLASYYADENKQLRGKTALKTVQEAIMNGTAKLKDGVADVSKLINKALGYDSSDRGYFVPIFNKETDGTDTPSFVTALQRLNISDTMIAQLFAIAHGNAFIHKYGDWRKMYNTYQAVQRYEQRVKPLLNRIKNNKRFEYIDYYEAAEWEREGKQRYDEAVDAYYEYLSEYPMPFETEEEYQEAVELLESRNAIAEGWNIDFSPRLDDLLEMYTSLSGEKMFNSPELISYIETRLKDVLGDDLTGKTIEQRLLSPENATLVSIYNNVNTKHPIVIKGLNSLENRRNILTALQNKVLVKNGNQGLISKRPFNQDATHYWYSIPKINTEANYMQNVNEGASQYAARTKNTVAYNVLKEYINANKLTWMVVSEKDNYYQVKVEKNAIDEPVIGSTPKDFHTKEKGEKQYVQTSLNFRLNSPQMKSKPTPKLLKIANQLSKITGIPYDTMTYEEAVEYMKEKGQSQLNAAAFYDSDNGRVVFIEREDMPEDTPFHEFIHPFIDVVEHSNPLLFQSLIKQLKADEIGQEAIKEVMETRKDLVEDDELNTLGLKEAITLALGKMAAGYMTEEKNGKLTTWLKNLLKAISKFFTRTFGKTIDPVKLGTETTLADIAEMFGVNDRRIKLFTIANGLQFQTVADENMKDYEASVQQLIKIRNAVRKQMNNLKQSSMKNKEEIMKRMRQLESMLDTIETKGFDTARMAVEAYSTLDEVHKSMDELNTLLFSGDNINLSTETAKNAIDALSFYDSVLEAYKWIGDLAKDIKSSYQAVKNEMYREQEKGLFNEPEVDEEGNPVRSIMWYINTANEHHQGARAQYDKMYKKVLANIIFPRVKDAMINASKELNDRLKPLEEEKAERERQGKRTNALDRQIAAIKRELEENIATDVDGFVKLFEQQKRDTSWIERILGPMTRSRDTVLAAFGLTIKTQKDKAMFDTIDDANKLSKIWKKFKAVASASRSNVSKFNEAVIERITKYEYVYDKEGKRAKVKRDYVAFVHEYDITKYEEAREKAMEEIKERAKKVHPHNTPTGISARNKYIKIEQAKWYQENTEPLSMEEIQAVKDRMREMMPSETAYRTWLNSVENEYGIHRDLRRPKPSKFPNAKWNAMYENKSTKEGEYKWVPKNPQGEYHQAYLAEYKRLQSFLPPAYQRGNILPSIRKNLTDRMIQYGGVSVAKAWYDDNFKRIDADDYEYGKDSLVADTSLSKDGFKEGVADDYKRIPIYFTGYMNADDVSLDLLSSLTLFAKEANNYRRMYEIKGEIDAMHRIIEEQEVIQTDAEGRKLMSKVAAKSQKVMEKYGVEDYAKKQGSNLRLQWFTAFMDMNVYGRRKIEQRVTIGGRTINIDKLTDSLLSFMAQTQLGGFNILKQVANGIQAHVQMGIEAWGNEHFGRGTMAKAGWIVNNHLHGMMKDTAAGEPMPTSFLGQLCLMYGLVQGNYEAMFGSQAHSFGTKVATGQLWMVGMNAGEVYNQALLGICMMLETKVKLNGKEISLYDAHEMVDGVVKLKEGVEFSEEQKFAFMNKNRALNENLNGVYNQFDAPAAKQYAMGRAIILYRNFVYGYFRNRFSGLRVDLMAGEATEGYYITTARIIGSRFKELAFLLGGESTLTAKEKAAVRKTMTELIEALVLMALVAMLRAYDDDKDKEEKTWLYKAAMYEIVRAKSELLFTVPILGTPDMLRTFATPTVASTMLERFVSLIIQLTTDPTGVYERDYGFAEKGDNKAWVKFLRLIGITGMNINPEGATQHYLRMY